LSFRQEYCPYCGSSHLVDSQITRGDVRNSLTSSLGLDFGPIRASIGGGGSQNNRSGTIRILQCATCLNIKTQMSSPSFPIHFISLNPMISVLPSSLLAQMKNFCCTEDHAHKMLKKAKWDIDSYYYDEFLKSTNPCSNNRMGHKMEVSFDLDNGHEVKVVCWLIIDLIPNGNDDIVTFHFSFMGREVTCP
jgi:hypothetical protein